MKKVLLATTALTLSAGIAAADGHAGITMSGVAEMGILDDGNNDVQFHQDIDLTFTMSGTTDNGLTFGTAIDIDEVDGDADNPFGGPQDGGVSVFISGDFGTLTLGDTDGAYDWALTEIVGGGSLADNEEHAGYGNGNAGFDGNGSTTDGQILRYDNTIGDFAFAVSYEQDAPTLTGVPGTAAAGDTIGVGVKGSFGDFSVGFGYQENDVDDIIGLSVGATFGAVNVVANASETDLGVDFVGVGVTYSEGPLTLHVNAAETGTVSGFGGNIGYDLGGGAEIQFGFGDDDTNNANWSLGVAMSF